MDRIIEYQKIIRRVIADYAEFLNGPPLPKFEVALALDDEHGQYVLRRVGWSAQEHYKYTDLHLMLRNGKIWIEEDMTEDGIANELLVRGVPREDIVLGFQPPFMRSQAESLPT